MYTHIYIYIYRERDIDMCMCTHTYMQYVEGALPLRLVTVKCLPLILVTIELKYY